MSHFLNYHLQIIEAIAGQNPDLARAQAEALERELEQQQLERDQQADVLDAAGDVMKKHAQALRRGETN